MAQRIRKFLYDTLIDQLKEGIVGVDKESKFIIFNKVAESIFGKSRSEVLGKFCWDIFPKEEFTRVINNFLRENELSFKEEVVEIARKAFLLQMAHTRNQENKVVGAIVLLNDLHKYRSLHDAVSQFVINVTHELKAPLTSIKGFIETLMEGAYQNSEVCYHFLQIINEETNRLVRLVINLLDYSYIESAKPQLKIQPVDIREVVEEALNILKPFAEQKNISVEVYFPEGFPLVKVDRDRLMQVVVSIIDNAIKFTGILGQGKIVIRAIEESNYVELCFEDTGVGISSSEQDKIFQRFYRVSDSRLSGVGGIGLGLSISREIVELFGGRITVESEPEKGSNFRVRLPKR